MVDGTRVNTSGLLNHEFCKVLQHSISNDLQFENPSDFIRPALDKFTNGPILENVYGKFKRKLKISSNHETEYR